MGCISCDKALERACQDLMKMFGLRYSNQHFPRLHLGAQGLFLCLNEHCRQNIQTQVQRLGPDPLPKVCLATKGAQILDLTGGFGRDAMVMVRAGGVVTCLEQHPYLAAMLYVLEQNWQHPNFHMIWVDAKVYLEQLDGNLPDVIYFDPMHPPREKSAKVKKPLQILQALIPPAQDVVEMITLAKQKAKQRVVLKWPAKQAKLMQPDFSIRGKTIDLDVFLVTSSG